MKIPINSLTICWRFSEKFRLICTNKVIFLIFASCLFTVVIACNSGSCPSGAYLIDNSSIPGGARYCEKEGSNGNLIKHGPYTQFYQGGGVARVMRFKNGLLDGKVTIYYSSGKKMAEIETQNGKKLGDWKVWDFTGRLEPASEANSIMRNIESQLVNLQGGQ